LKKPQPPAPDYEKGVEYWEGIEASVDGVLGGFGEGVSYLFLHGLGPFTSLSYIMFPL
jgi:hypothetical protein